jgi:two-component system, chemotaxis family, sensor histidine kinase and response regulator PixL
LQQRGIRFSAAHLQSLSWHADMSTDPTIRDQTYTFFLMEAPELLQNIEQDLLSLREDRSTGKVHNLMRLTHTLKGAAASVGLETIKTVAHSLEDVFKSLYNPEIEIDPELESLLFQGYECLRLPLTAEFTGTAINESEILNRAASVFAQLQVKLGDFFDQQAIIPSSAELGFDIVQSIFETGVKKRLADLQKLVNTADEQKIATALQEEATVFSGLGESLGLPGFGRIATTTLAALNAQPQQALAIAQIALADFQQAQAIVLAGDRDRGGEPSADLVALAAALPADASAATATNPALDLNLPLHLDLDLSLDQVDTWAMDSRGTAANELDLVAGFSFDAAAPQVLSLEDLDLPLDLPELLPEQFLPLEQPVNLADADIDLEDLEQINPEASADLSLEDLLGNINLEGTLADFTPPATADLVIPVPQTIANIPPAIATPAIAPEPPVTIPRAKEPSAPLPTVRVDLEKLQHLNYLSGELLTYQNQQTDTNVQLQEVVQKLQLQLEQHQQLLSHIRDLSDRLLVRSERQRSLVAVETAAPWSRFDALEMDPYSEFHVLLQSGLEETVQLSETCEAIALFSQQSGQTLEKQQRLLTQTRDDLMQVGMLPLGELFNRFPRMLQQLVQVHDKPAQMRLLGTDVLMDKAIAEKLYDPILHLVRNGFDHGIEPSSIRLQQGKSEMGLIQLQAYQQERATVITVSDDGKGLDFEKIRSRALEMRLLNPEQRDQVTEGQLLEFLFEPGFSTASELSELSGRGIGLDVVKTQVQSLKGTITIQSRPGQGTTFVLEIPRSLNIARVLVCQAAAQNYAFLLDAVEQIVLPHPEQIQDWRGQRVFHWQKGSLEYRLPIRKLSELIPYSLPLAERSRQAAAPTETRLLILRRSTEFWALEVDQVVGEQELVIRPVGKLIAPPPFVQGCCILADGRLTLMIDSVALLEQGSLSLPEPALTLRADHADRTPTAAIPAAKVTQILVVDDSITLRQNLALVLQKAGYHPIQARDGAEALSHLEQHPEIRMVICDVEMPGMNGFEFLSHRAQSPQLVNIPVVMLTSRGSDKHRQIAQALGANHYLTKPYLDQELLNTVARFVGVSDA